MVQVISVERACQRWLLPGVAKGSSLAASGWTTFGALLGARSRTVLSLFPLFIYLSCLVFFFNKRNLVISNSTTFSS